MKVSHKYVIIPPPAAFQVVLSQGLVFDINFFLCSSICDCDRLISGAGAPNSFGNCRRILEKKY